MTAPDIKRRVAVDKKGRVYLTSEVMEASAIKEGDEVNLSYIKEDGAGWLITLSPIYKTGQIKEKGR